MAKVNYGSLPFKEAIDHFNGKVNLPTSTWTDIWEGAHSRAFVVAGAMRDELLTDLRGAVASAIESGTTLEQFRKDFDGIVQKHGWPYKGGRNWRTRVIYETNLRTSYQAGRYKQMQRVTKTRPYWRYKHSDSVAVPRPPHLEWNGLILRHDDPWWDTHYPSNGWGCQCTVQALSQRDLDRLGKSATDIAPPIEWEERTVGSRGPNPRTVKVPKGIDPGWGYNVGESAWGRSTAQRLVGEHNAGRGWETLTPGNWQTNGRPQQLPTFRPTATVGPRLHTTQEAVTAIKQIIGGKERTYALKTGNVSYPLHVDAQTLGEHIKLDRTPFLPLLPELLENPQEVWMTFEKHRQTGKVALRVRSITVLGGEKGRGYLLVTDAQAGHLLGWTFTPYKLSALNKVRKGKLIYAKD